MQIGISIITDTLEEYAQEIKINNLTAQYKQISFLHQEEQIYHNSVLYLQSSEDNRELENYPESCIFLYTDSPDLLPKIPNRIILKKGISCLNILMLLENTLNRLNHWSDSLKESLLNEEGIKALINLSIPIFENPILYINSEYRVLFLSDVPDGVHLSDIYGEQLVEGCIMGDYMMDAIHCSDKYKDTLINNGAAIWEDGKWNGRFMNVNHLTDGIIDGCILLSDCNRPFRPSDAFLLEYLLSIISRAIQRRNIYPHSSIKNLKIMLQKVINSESPPNIKFIENLADSCNWSIDHTFLCTIVSPSSQDIIHKALLYHCIQLEELFYGSKAFEINTQIILIIDLTKAQISREAFIEILKPYLKKAFLQASVSLPFKHLNNIQKYYQQAAAILSTGNKIDSNEFLFLFESYALHYMINHSSGELTGIQLLPQGLISIIEHDNRHHTKYCQLLQTYLENDRNISKSTQILFMHRSTFLYQLDRIKELIEMNLEDKDVRLYLILTLRIIQKENFFVEH